MNELREYQTILLDILKDVAVACNQMGIPYYLTEGTCLGAVRHKGFIPWDDDIDIAIPSSYYERFIRDIHKYLKKEHSVEPGFITGDYTRVVNTQIEVKSDVLTKGKSYHPWIDIMCLYGMPNNLVVREIHYIKFYLAQKLFKMSDSKNIIRRKRNIFESIIVSIVSRINLTSILNKEKRLKKVQDLLFRYSFESSNYVLGYTSWYFKKELMPKEVYGSGTNAIFEGEEIRIPSDYDTYLKRLYGDYMTLPPEEERQGKHKLTIVPNTPKNQSKLDTRTE